MITDKERTSLLKEDIKKLNKEQLEDTLLFFFEQADSRIEINKEASDGLMKKDEDLAWDYKIYHNALYTMRTLIGVKISMEINKNKQ